MAKYNFLLKLISQIFFFDNNYTFVIFTYNLNENSYSFFSIILFSYKFSFEITI